MSSDAVYMCRVKIKDRGKYELQPKVLHFYFYSNLLISRYLIDIDTVYKKEGACKHSEL